MPKTCSARLRALCALGLELLSAPFQAEQGRTQFHGVGCVSPAAELFLARRLRALCVGKKHRLSTPAPKHSAQSHSQNAVTRPECLWRRRRAGCAGGVKTTARWSSGAPAEAPPSGSTSTASSNGGARAQGMRIRLILRRCDENTTQNHRSSVAGAISGEAVWRAFHLSPSWCAAPRAWLQL